MHMFVYCSAQESKKDNQVVPVRCSIAADRLNPRHLLFYSTHIHLLKCQAFHHTIASYSDFPSTMPKQYGIKLMLSSNIVIQNI